MDSRKKFKLLANHAHCGRLNALTSTAITSAVANMKLM